MLGAGSIHTRSERALWAAVLVNALFDLLDGFEFIDRGTIHRESSRDWRNSGRQKRQREAEAVRYWLNRESRDPGGYGFVAEALDIDADRLRRRIFEIATDDELRDYVLGNTGGHQKAKRARLLFCWALRRKSMHCRIRTDGMLELRRAGCDFYVQRCPERPIQGPDQLCGDWCPRLLENNNTNGDAETVTLSCVHSAPVFMVAEDLRAEEIRRIKDDPGDEA